MDKEPFPGYNNLIKELLDSGDYEEYEDGIRLKGSNPFPGQSGIRCFNLNCQHDLYVDGISVCNDCLKLETGEDRTCHLCGNIMQIL